MKKIAIVVALVPMICFATVDHLVKTYQPLYCPQKGIQIVPVHFLTMFASPDVEISMIGTTNALIQSDALPGGGNANLASLFGFSVTPDDIKHKGPASVTVDMTHVAKPEEHEFSPTQVLEATVQCLTRLLQEHGHTVLRVQIKCPKERLPPEWKQFQKSYDLTKDKKGQP